MKNTTLILLIIFSLISCSSQKVKSKIIYTLPFIVTERIYEKLKTIDNTDGISFTLGNDTGENYIIYINMPKQDEYKFWIENTNRAILIKDKTYPLVLESDEYFSYPEDEKLVLRKLEQEESIKKITVMRDNVFNVRFNLNGEIIK
ncbi:hypothetical protein [Chryseobacterium luteum]|uniref:Uncharacterized protein n=1 Tax=Chryseobacterium luteum TaxID=421531 RepID=A0A085ZHE9_9FLAO|nr:hypothetical protein [Chryseobacterium luteum]KFF03863.1 hypothetical protein IX38_10670 [Chryseobacterium luteum]